MEIDRRCYPVDGGQQKRENDNAFLGIEYSSLQLLL